MFKIVRGETIQLRGVFMLSKMNFNKRNQTKPNVGALKSVF